MMKKIFVLLGTLFLFLNVSTITMADVKIGKCDANLDSLYSNDYKVEWYNFPSPTITGKSGLLPPPEVLALTNTNLVVIRMDFRLRDDSRARGEDQLVKMEVYRWDPNNYSWVYVGADEQSRSSSRTGKHLSTGDLMVTHIWNSSDQAVKYKVIATAKSGGSTTSTRYFWIARGTTPLGSDAEKARLQWRCSRYDRSALYKQMANAWREMKSSPTGDGFKSAMDQIIDLGKEFVAPNPTSLGIDLGINAVSLLAPASAVVQALGEVNSLLAQAVGWVSTATDLLGPGLQSAISTAVTPSMVQQATQWGSANGLDAALNNVADYARADAEQAMNRQAMLNEKAQVESALAACTSARSAISDWLSGYTSSGFQNLPGGVGSGNSSAAQAVADQLRNFISGVEKNLNFDKDLLDKMTKY